MPRRVEPDGCVMGACTDSTKMTSAMAPTIRRLNLPRNGRRLPIDQRRSQNPWLGLSPGVSQGHSPRSSSARPRAPMRARVPNFCRLEDPEIRGGAGGGQSDDSPKSPASSTKGENTNDNAMVAPSRLELERGFPRGILSRTAADLTEHERESSEESDARSDTGRPERPPQAPQVVSETDPVELALATALERASAAGQWTAVEVLARELESRRKARAGVVQLDSERRKRER